MHGVWNADRDYLDRFGRPLRKGVTSTQQARQWQNPCGVREVKKGDIGRDRLRCDQAMRATRAHVTGHEDAGQQRLSLLPVPHRGIPQHPSGSGSADETCCDRGDDVHEDNGEWPSQLGREPGSTCTQRDSAARIGVSDLPHCRGDDSSGEGLLVRDANADPRWRSR